MKKQNLKIFAAAVLMAAVLAGCSSHQPEQTTAAETEAAEQAKEDVPAAEPSAEEETEAEVEAWVPEKEISFVVPFDAGGSADIPARILTKYLNKYSDQTITVVNIPGSGGRIGANEVRRAEPDGYTIMHVPVGWYMQYATGVADFSYEDFENITLWCDSWVGLVVQADSEWETYEDFIASARERELMVGAVTGTLPVLAEMAIEQKEDVVFDLVDLGTGAKAPELLSGRVDAYVDAIGEIKPYVDSGEFRCLCVFAHDRVPAMADVPTIEELGYTDFDYLLQSFGLWAPKGTPEGALYYFSDLIRQAAEDPGCQEEFEAIGYGTVSMTPPEYHEFCKIVQDATTEAVAGMID